MVVALEQLLRHAARQKRPLLMGVINLTPDSFFDGGDYLDAPAWQQRVNQLMTEGADILDFGAESSRPGAQPVAPEAQMRRLREPIEYAIQRKAVVSVDTTHPQVAAQCLELGARIINDVSCLRDSALARVTVNSDAWLILTHSRAPMKDMAGFSTWPDDDYPVIVQDVLRDWRAARERAVAQGVRAERIIFDPGFGFSKNARHSYELLAKLDEFHCLDCPILSAPSRKSFLAAFDGAPPAERLPATLAANLISAQRGAHILRVHDVKQTRQALNVWRACQNFNLISGRGDPDSGANIW